MIKSIITNTAQHIVQRTASMLPAQSRSVPFGFGLRSEFVLPSPTTTNASRYMAECSIV